MACRVFLTTLVLTSLVATGCATPTPLSGLSKEEIRFNKETDGRFVVFVEAFSLVRCCYVSAIKPNELVHAAVRGMLIEIDPEGSTTPPEVLKSIESLSNLEDTLDSLKVFGEAVYLLESRYPNKTGSRSMTHAAIRGMMENIDPHGSFIPPEIFREMQLQTLGGIGGIGIEMTVRDRLLTVVSPIEGSPADRAGLQAGDRIIRIEGRPTKDLTLMEAMLRLRGPKGSKVTISILREGAREPMDITLLREAAEVKNIRSKDLGDSIKYIRIRSFQDRTAEDLENTLEQAQKAGATALILDLRNNPGGLLNQAVAVSDMFLDKGQLITYIQGRQKNQDLRFTAERGHRVWKDLMVVLVNKGSAAGSEIVASALQDWKRAIVLGAPTVGRASVQSVIPLSDGSALTLTTGRFITPSGQLLEDKGVTPDIVVEFPPPEGKHDPQRWSTLRGIGNLDVDVQLRRAVEVLKDKLK